MLHMALYSIEIFSRDDVTGGFRHVHVEFARFSAKLTKDKYLESFHAPYLLKKKTHAACYMLILTHLP